MSATSCIQDKQLGVNVVVETIPGPDGYNRIYSAKPDGYTIGIADPVSKKSGFTSFDQVKASAQPVRVAAVGVAAPLVQMILLSEAAGLKTASVNFRTPGDVIFGVVRGDADVGHLGAQLWMKHIEAGSVTPLLIAADQFHCRPRRRGHRHHPRRHRIRRPDHRGATLHLCSIYLSDGLDLVAVIIGFLVVSEAIGYLFQRRQQGGIVALPGASRATLEWRAFLRAMREPLRYPMTVIRSSAIGTPIGAVPGVGGVVARFFSYNMAYAASKEKDQYGKGSVEGLIAAEAAVDAKEGGILLPTVVFGIPGNGETAPVLARAVTGAGLTRDESEDDVPLKVTARDELGWSVIARAVAVTAGLFLAAVLFGIVIGLTLATFAILRLHMKVPLRHAGLAAGGLVRSHRDRLLVCAREHPDALPPREAGAEECRQIHRPRRTARDQVHSRDRPEGVLGVPGVLCAVPDVGRTGPLLSDRSARVPA
jgi:hypothetical protein